MIPKTTPKKRIIVHLGNVGYDSARKTRTYADRFNEFKFVGIDKKNIHAHTTNKVSIPKNLKQIESEFLTGILKLKDKSVDLITSDFAVGHYALKEKEKIHGSFGSPKTYLSHKEYTERIMQLCYNKLKVGGKAIFVVFVSPLEENNALGNIKLGIKNIPFQKVDVQTLSPEKLKNISSHWSRFLGMSVIEGQEPYKFYRITLVK